MIPDRIPGLLYLPLITLLLAACGGGGSKGSSAAPPSNVQVHPGDQSITVTWTNIPNVEYWVFIGPPGTTPDNFASTTGAYAFANVATPLDISSVQLNGLSVALNNGKEYTVTVNARTNGGPGGPSSSPLKATPTASGVVWHQGSTLVNTTDGAADTLYGATYGVPLYNDNGVYISNNRPPEFVFVGHNGAAYYSTVNPADGQSYTMTSVNSGIPSGSDLNAVSWEAGIGFLAVGSNGQATLSPDGITWTVQNTGVTSTLRSIVPTGGTGFIVLGDNCSVWQTSTGGSGQTTAWNNYSAGFTSSTPFTSACGGSTPISLLGATVGGSFVTAVGTQGTIAFTSAYGTTSATWAAAQPAFPSGVTASQVNLRSIQYGVVYETQTDGSNVAYPLWVAVGDYTDSGNVVRPLILYTTAGPTAFTAGSSGVWNSWTVATLPSGLSGSLYSVAFATDPVQGGVTQLVASGDNGLILRQLIETPVFDSTGAYSSFFISDTPGQTWTQASSISSNASLYALARGHFGAQAVGTGGFWEYTY